MRNSKNSGMGRAHETVIHSPKSVCKHSLQRAGFCRPAPRSGPIPTALYCSWKHLVFSRNHASQTTKTVILRRKTPVVGNDYFRLRKYTSLLMDSSLTSGPLPLSVPRS